MASNKGNVKDTSPQSTKYVKCHGGFTIQKMQVDADKKALEDKLR